MRVLQVIPKLGYGGAETGCYDLAHYLYEKDCKSFIVTSGGDLLKFVKKDKVKIFKLPVHSKNILIMLFNALVISLISVFLKLTLFTQEVERQLGHVIGHVFLLEKSL